MTETIEPMTAQIDQQQLAQELVEQARSQGVELPNVSRAFDHADQQSKDHREQA